MAGPKPKPLSELFWNKVDVGWTDECWNWNGSLGRAGYGQFTTGLVRGYTNVAHRMAYTLINGDPGVDFQVDHLCHNKLCSNPGHLEAVSQQENLRRARIDGLRTYSKSSHCKRGHAFSPENTGSNGMGGQACKTCKSLNHRNRKAQAYGHDSA